MKPPAGYAYNSRWFAELCAQACEQALEDPRNAITAVIFAAVWVEAFLNDYLVLLRTSLYPFRNATVRRLMRLSAAADLEGKEERLVRRYQIVGTILTDAEMDLGVAPWQELQILITLRNALVHNRPERIEVEVAEGADGLITRVRDLPTPIKALIARGIVTRPDEYVFLSNAGGIQTKEVADWAFAAAKAVVLAAYSWLPADELLAHPFSSLLPEGLTPTQGTSASA